MKSATLVVVGIVLAAMLIVGYTVVNNNNIPKSSTEVAAIKNVEIKRQALSWQ